MSTRKDILLVKSFALPAAAGIVNSEAFDLFNAKTPNDIHDVHAEFVVRTPAVDLPNNTSLMVSVVSSDSETFNEEIQSFVLGTITGKTAERQFTVKPAEKPKRYWRASITATGSIGNLSALKAEFNIEF